MTSNILPSARLAAVDANMLSSVGASHTWRFAALAELLDNSRDAGASIIKIDAEEIFAEPTTGGGAGWSLRVSDDGSGMTKGGLESMLDFGTTEHTSSRVGMYGMGAKSGMMGCASDALVLTMKDGGQVTAELKRGVHVLNFPTFAIGCGGPSEPDSAREM